MKPKVSNDGNQCFARLRRRIGRIAIVALAIVQGLVAADGRAQDQKKNAAKSNEQKAQELLNDKTYSFEDLLNAKPGAVADAKKIFALASDSNIKQRAASILLSIGLRDPVYFDYLSREAEKALRNDTPWPTLYDKDGNTVRKTFNPDFLKWCERRHVKKSDAFEAVYYRIPVSWNHFAAAGDPRSYDLLIKGLHSHNLMISALSAEGLAKLQDPRAIDEIIAAYHRAPAETRNTVSRALVFFPDPRAQAAAEEFIKDKSTLALYRKEAEAKGAKALFGY